MPHLNAALRLYLTSRLSGTGLTKEYICDLFNVSRNEAAAILTELGAKNGHGTVYRLPGRHAESGGKKWDSK